LSRSRKTCDDSAALNDKGAAMAPIYDFECQCGRKREEFTHAHERPVIRCECGREMRPDYQAENGSNRSGELPDWVSIGAGVCPTQSAEASRHYAHLGVTFDDNGHAHVPGRNRTRFLKERGLDEK